VRGWQPKRRALRGFIQGKEVGGVTHHFLAKIKGRILRPRLTKKAIDWLALIQLACAHVLLNVVVFG
jgi:hypothetical protein